MTAIMGSDVVEYAFDVPLMTCIEGAVRIRHELSKLLDPHFDGFYGLYSRVTCDYETHEVKVVLYVNGNISPQDVINKINSMNSERFFLYPQFFKATLKTEPPSNSYLPMSSNMGASSSYHISSSAEPAVEYSSDENSTYSSDSVSDNDSEEFDSSMMKIRF